MADAPGITKRVFFWTVLFSVSAAPSPGRAAGAERALELRAPGGEASPTLQVSTNASGEDEVELRLLSVARTKVEPIVVDATPLLGPENLVVPVAHALVRDRNGVTSLEPGQSATLRLRARLPKPGLWKTQISVMFGAEPTTLALVVQLEKRALPAAPPKELQADPALHIRGETGTAQLALPLGLREREGRAMSLRARLGEWVVHGPKDETWTVTPRLSLTSSGTTGAETGRATAFELPARGATTAQPELQLTGLEGAGRYDGKVIVEGEGTSATIAVQVALREPWTTAAGYVVLGVLASFLGGIFARALRAQLVALERVEKLAKRLSALAKVVPPTGPVHELDEVANEKLRALQGDLGTWRARAGFAGKAMLAAIAGSPSEREGRSKQVDLIDVYVEALHDLVAAWGDMQAALSEELRATVTSSLTTAVKELVKATTQPEAEEARKKIRDAGVEAKARETNAALIRALSEEVKAARITTTERLPTTAPAAPADDEAPDALRRLALTRLDTAEDQLLGLRSRTMNLEEVRLGYEQARAAFAAALALELRASLKEGPLPGFTTTEWDAVRGPANDELAKVNQHPADPVGQLRRAEQLIVLRIIAHLRPHLARIAQLARAAGRSEDATALEARYGQITFAITADSARYGDGERFARDLAALDKKLNEPPTDRARTSAVTGVETTSTPRERALPSAMPVPLAGFVAPPSTAEARLVRHDVAILLFTLTVAILGGLKVLWVDDTSWGGLSAHLTAFLWGLGVQYASGSPFEGLVSLYKKLAG